MQLTSFQNPQIKLALKLQNRRSRNTTGLFLIEGYRELLRAVEANVSIVKVFFCPEFFLGENEEDLLANIQSKGGRAYVCKAALFRKMSYRDRPDGLLAIGEQMQITLANFQERMGKNPLIVIAEGIEKPGNLGSIIRSADGAGANGVIVCDKCTDIYNPNVVRASVGTLFTLPVVEEKAEKIISWLQEQKISVVATTPLASCCFTEAILHKPVAIVVGTEQWGLSEKWFTIADQKVFIPMKGVADSLNVSTATTLLLYEALKQRERG